MARGEKEYSGKSVWVDMKDSKGNIVKDGKGNAVKTRKFGKGAEEAPKAAPKAAPKISTKSAPKEKPVTKDAMKGYRAGDVTTSKVDKLSGAARSTVGKVKNEGILKGASASATAGAGAGAKGKEAPVGGKMGIMPPKLSPKEMVKLTPLERAKRNQQATLARAAQRKASGMAKGGMSGKKGC